MVFYTIKDIIAALHSNFCAILPSDTYRFNIWASKKNHFHLSILKLNQNELCKEEKLDQIRLVTTNVYEDLSEKDPYFNKIFNPYVREIRRDLFSVDFIVLYNDDF